MRLFYSPNHRMRSYTLRRKIKTKTDVFAFFIKDLFQLNTSKSERALPVIQLSEEDQGNNYIL